MKEKLYTIPLNDALLAKDECPFCFIERNTEQNLLDFILGSGSSYMESDIREQTDKAGFCRKHFQKMFQYGNTLGNAWILKTHYRRMIEEMKHEFSSYESSQPKFKQRFRKPTENSDQFSGWLKEKEESCYICNQFNETFKRYLDTFFIMYKKDSTFREQIKSGKGFCLHHFGILYDYSKKALSEKEQQEFYSILFPLMESNMERLYEDISWMVEKFDYRNKDADWKTSKDAIQRGMQKLKGGYPANPIYKMNP